MRKRLPTGIWRSASILLRESFVLICFAAAPPSNGMNFRRFDHLVGAGEQAGLPQ